MNEPIDQITITDSDIEKAECHFNLKFNADQKEVIKFLKSADVQACPGSGKTTTLAAKLFILCDKLPLTYNQGICVITHTNVAVNEIKSKLGDAGTRLLKYPNHFGTIQSFVDKFLTIPGYITEFKSRPERIDDDIYFKQLEGKFKSTYDYRMAQTSLSHRNIESWDLRFSCDDFALVKSVYGDAIGIRADTPTVINATRCKMDVLLDGYIGFEDAYAVAFRYLRNYPKIKNLFASRFSHVFIDEMQDMDSFQAKILAEVFDAGLPGTCLQRIGDINQAIFSSRAKTENNYWKPQNHLEIKTSLRLSKTIAERVHNVCISPQALGGREDTPQIKPVIIGFDEKTNISSVKTKFAELIVSNGIHNIVKSSFKAIGLKKDHGKALDSKGNLKLSIKDYFEEYNYLHTVKKSDFSSFTEYLAPPHKTTKEVYENFIFGILKLLRIAKIQHPDSKRYFTNSSLQKYLSEFHPEMLAKMRLKLVSWLKSLMKDQQAIKDIIQFIQSDFWKIWETEMTEEVTAFLTKPIPVVNPQQEPDKLSINNRYLFEDGEIKFPIQFGTIHSVKGETHTATLYLETYNRTFDVEKIVPFILGETKQTARTKNSGRLKTSYVAMTRPTHLLCVAVRTSVISNQIEDLNNSGWDVTILE